MLRLQRIHTADRALYDFMERLLVASFPAEEYRALDQLRQYADTREAFHCNVILGEDDTPIGLFNYWDFGTFCYGEHFAIDPARRNGGQGKRALEELCRRVHPRPIVLEVEMPMEEMAQRRIGFYERQGFTLWDKPYQQPPYKPGDDFLLMRLMAYGNIDPETAFDTVCSCIHREVYGVTSAPVPNN